MKYFGTDGFRGTANEELNVEHAYRIGRYMGWHFKNEGRGKIVIGKDTRRSSYMFENALCAGITASGADAYLLHVTTTPSVSYVVRTEDFDCGIMISASHNPYYDNGIKLINGYGEKMGDDLTEKIEEYIDGAFDVPFAAGADIGIVVDYAAGRNRYAGYLISLSRHSFKDKRIGLDCSNGSTWMLAKSVFDALGATTFVINNTPDGKNINLNCGSTHIEGLQALVREKGLDAGFAFDGDADRCLAVDENGNVVNGDAILYLCGSYMKDTGELGASKVVTTVMSNMGLYKALDTLGIGYEQTAVGDRFVYENMKENGHLIGGEQSGHIIFSKYANTGDGLLTAIKVMEVMLSRKQTLSQLVAELPVYPQVLINVRVQDKKTVLQDAGIKAKAAELEAALCGDGRILLRPSGTEPLIRVMVEAGDAELCSITANALADLIREKFGL